VIVVESNVVVLIVGHAMLAMHVKLQMINGSIAEIKLKPKLETTLQETSKATY
jgi:hypothetical protein